MNRRFLTFPFLTSITALAVPGFSADQSEDEAAIHSVETGLQEAWNHHDAQAFASFFAEDADCVNVVGRWWKGRPQIEVRSPMPTYLFFEKARSLIMKFI